MVNFIKRILIFAPFVMFHCYSAKLTIHPHIDNESSLRLDGYYYEYVSNKYSITTVYFIYSNGVLLNIGNPVFADVEKYLEEYLIFREKNKPPIYHWGAVNLSKKTVIIEKWEPSSGGGAKTFICHGKVLNDTTFVVNEVIDNYENGKKRNVDITYHFKQFSPKPDSTNQFVK